MSSEALDRALEPECACGTKLSVCWKCYESRCLKCDPYEESDDCAASSAEAEAALRAAREREQRLRLALRDAIANLDAAVCADYPLWAALVDEPAAATLSEPGSSEGREDFRESRARGYP